MLAGNRQLFLGDLSKLLSLATFVNLRVAKSMRNHQLLFIGS